ncbi:MAG: Holliday junction resolvase RuvX [Bacilli bacterium]|nr:Holliday junction resolvase RuvX [Bacilli bacterium]
MNKILAFDLGSRTLGIAVSDSLGIAAHGLENFRFPEGGYQAAIAHALEIINREHISELVIGLALNMNGEESKSSQASRIFKEELLKRNANLKITMVDERLTTKLATQRLLEADLSREKRKKVIDMQSAVVILETYMEMKKNAKI